MYTYIVQWWMYVHTICVAGDLVRGPLLVWSSPHGVVSRFTHTIIQDSDNFVHRELLILQGTTCLSGLGAATCCKLCLPSCTNWLACLVEQPPHPFLCGIQPAGWIALHEVVADCGLFFRLLHVSVGSETCTPLKYHVLWGIEHLKVRNFFLVVAEWLAVTAKLQY